PLQTQILGRVGDLKTAAGDEYLLVPLKTPRYWAPVDPVVLLAGPPLAPLYRNVDPASQDANGNLVCRLATNLVTTPALASGPCPVTAAQLPQLPTSPNQSHTADLRALFGELFLTDARQAAVVARATGSGSAALTAEVAQAQAGFLAGKPVAGFT